MDERADAGDDEDQATEVDQQADRSGRRTEIDQRHLRRAPESRRTRFRGRDEAKQKTERTALAPADLQPMISAVACQRIDENEPGKMRVHALKLRRIDILDVSRLAGPEGGNNNRPPPFSSGDGDDERANTCARY